MRLSCRALRRRFSVRDHGGSAAWLQRLTKVYKSCWVPVLHPEARQRPHGLGSTGAHQEPRGYRRGVIARDARGGCLVARVVCRLRKTWLRRRSRTCQELASEATFHRHPHAPSSFPTQLMPQNPISDPSLARSSRRAVLKTCHIGTCRRTRHGARWVIMDQQSKHRLRKRKGLYFFCLGSWSQKISTSRPRKRRWRGKNGRL